MENEDVNINEEANFDDWEYKTFISPTERTNVLTQQRQLAADLPLFKSDFETDMDYFNYLILKKTQLDERQERK